MPPIITAKNISKEYTLLHRLPYYTLRDSIVNLVKKPVELFHRGTQPAEGRERFLALDNVSFSIDQGERVGIIGRNGAGKSTLLKILSQITPPTRGEIRLRGKVASLLEVGTGFNPELTGRENIFLNGAILGMKRSEVLRKFDEIIAFSEIEKFLDTPVKRYSSGMYVRLAFAVAAHLEPDILIVDEVLAVGDAQFQKKCLGKMQDVAGQGRTILFVSHNMAAISQLCSRIIVLQDGKIDFEGPPQQAIPHYLSIQARDTSGSADLSDFALRKNSLAESVFQWTRISLENSNAKSGSIIRYREPFSIVLEGKVHKTVNNVRLGLALQSSLGFPVLNTFQTDGGIPALLGTGQIGLTVRIDPNILSPGLYEISLGANGPGVIDWIPTALQFTVIEAGIRPEIHWENYRGGFIYYPFSWSCDYVERT